MPDVALPEKRQTDSSILDLSPARSLVPSARLPLQAGVSGWEVPGATVPPPAD